MRKFRSRLLQSLLFAAAATFVTPAGALPPAAEAVAGVWKVHATPDSAAIDAGQMEFDEMILFEDDTLTAEACAAYGFAPAAFSVSEEGEFTASLTSENQGTIVWTGQSTLSGLTGTLVWTKSDGNVFRYSITAVRPPNDEFESGQSDAD